MNVHKKSAHRGPLEETEPLKETRTLSMISAWRWVQVCTTLEYEFPLLKNLLFETDLAFMNFVRPKQRQILNHLTEIPPQPGNTEDSHGREFPLKMSSKQQQQKNNYKVHEDTLCPEGLL